MKIKGKSDKTIDDSDFLAMNDKAIQNFRANESDAKRKIVKKMLTLQHNMKYNKHLLSVYMKAKELFDKMVDEHRLQLHSLDEIYRHLNHLIRENMTKKRIHSKNSVSSEVMAELVKDKKRIGGLVKKMRNSYDKLMNVNTIIGVAVDKINEITFIDDDDKNVNETKEDYDDDEEDMDDEDDEDDDEDMDDEDEDEEEDDEDIDDEDMDDEDEDMGDEDDEEDIDDDDEEDMDHDDEEDDEEEEPDHEGEADPEYDDDNEDDEYLEEEEDEEEEEDTDDDEEDEGDEKDNESQKKHQANDPNRFIYVF